MELPMRGDLRVGSRFPDFQLPDHTVTQRRLSHVLGGFSGALIFDRGQFCPKGRRQFTNYAEHRQPRLPVNYCHLITVSVDGQETTADQRDALGAEWTFLHDADRELLYELDMVDTTDPKHGDIYIPYTFILDRDRTLYKVYNRRWYVGRPTAEEIRMDWRALLRKRDGWVYQGGD